jgi:hypothetical protein
MAKPTESMALMFGVTSTVQWLGAQVTGFVDRQLDQRLNQAGEAWLARSRALAPVKTGFLRSQEDYQVIGRTLTLIMGAPYDIFQEFGTRNIRPRPHIRPALLEMQRIFGTDVALEFNRPGASVWTGLYAHEGRFIEPSKIQPRPLTHRQREHVRQHLMPVSKRLHKGAVKRAKMRVRRFT